MPDTPFSPRRPVPHDVVLPVAVDADGRRGPTKGQAAGPRWIRVGRNAYVPATVDRDRVDQRIAEATCYLPASGALTGWAALRWVGAAYFDGRHGTGGGDLPVPLALGRSTGKHVPAHLEVSYEALGADEVVVVGGVPVTLPVRSLFYELRRPGDWRDRVVAIDMAAAARFVSTRMVQAYHSTHSGWRRAGLAADAVAYASEGSRSPAETRMRLLWVVDAGLPEPLVNTEVFGTDGRLICIADLFDPQAGLVVEYDGAEHRKAARHSRDVAREEACRRVGLEYCKVTGPDMHDRGRVVERFLSTRSRAAFLVPEQCRWTLTRPPGRSRTEPLDDLLERRARIAMRMRREHGVDVPPW